MTVQATGDCDRRGGEIAGNLHIANPLKVGPNLLDI
jgi:hypothetical protein